MSTKHKQTIIHFTGLALLLIPVLLGTFFVLGVKAGATLLALVGLAVVWVCFCLYLMTWGE